MWLYKHYHYCYDKTFSTCFDRLYCIAHLELVIASGVLFNNSLFRCKILKIALKILIGWLNSSVCTVETNNSSE